MPAHDKAVCNVHLHALLPKPATAQSWQQLMMMGPCRDTIPVAPTSLKTASKQLTAPA